MNETHLHENPKRTTPIGMARYSADFFEAALAADDKMGMKKGYEITAPVPVMFLVGQSIELILKAYLLHKGVSLRKLRQKYGHVLHRCLRKAKELGLLEIVDLSEEDQEMIEILDELYSSKQLQYIVSGAKTYPVFGPLEAVCRKLITSVGPEVGYVPRNIRSAL
ncbi:HEPN domain-containing protein [Thiohalophilus sp.]|uniref:HEPN domain-containing protein n=1 Tax=Thiohalophilus sp. TaxID=3028392 RepID=UPI002ACD3774|nr:HEPN domain-containing protein [Thiohalophilus sp.]MDZ7805118.1 HEPN domain-containing protein [Thiohalophilus sp.]